VSYFPLDAADAASDGEAKQQGRRAVNTMKSLNCGDVIIDVTPQEFADEAAS
jgi:hypothetical protein